MQIRNSSFQMFNTTTSSSTSRRTTGKVPGTVRTNFEKNKSSSTLARLVAITVLSKFERKCKWDCATNVRSYFPIFLLSSLSRHTNTHTQTAWKNSRSRNYKQPVFILSSA